MSKISVTTIAGLTSGGDANKVKIESGDTLQVESNATVGGTLGVTGAATLSGTLGVDGHSSIGNSTTVAGTRALTVVGASDGSGSEILNCYNSSLASKFSVRDDGIINAANLILAPTGIRIGGTATGNTLDDYEEGTFTPTLLDSGDDLNPNYTFQAGQYTKVGNKVTFALRINSNSHDSDGDQLYVGGLPFAVNFTNTSNRIYVQVDGSGLNIDAGSGYYKLVGQLTNTNQSITLLQQGDVVVQNNFRANDLSQTKEIYITGTYFTNS